MINKILLAVVFFSIFSSIAESESYILKYNLHIGEVQVYKSQMNLSSNVTVKPENSSVKDGKREEIKALINISAWTIIKCVSKAENEFICECRFFAPEAEFTINSPTSKIKALIFTTLFSFLAPISWFVVFKAHSFKHIHMNFIVWHMPFIIFGFILLGLFFKDTLKKLLTVLGLNIKHLKDYS